MNPEFEEKHEETQETRPNSFGDPRTVPEKWDVSAFVPRRTSSTNDYQAEAPDSVEQSETESSEDQGTHRNPDPFPQPRTVPGKWDVSNLR
jgi:hypothetical protein